MRKRRITNTGIIRKNETYEAKSIETMLAERMEGQDIEMGGKALLYTEKKDGVIPETNIRSDRWDLAMMALDSVERSRIARRDGTGDVKKDKPNESLQGTENN